MSQSHHERFRFCQRVEKEICHASADRLRQIQNELNDTVPASMGIFTFIFPLMFSTFFMVLSFGTSQFPVWEMVVQLLGLAPTMTMVLVVISSLLCGVVYIIPVFIMSKGYMVAAKVHFGLAWFTLAAAALCLISSLLRVITAESSFIAPLLSLAFVAASFLLIRSKRFYDSLLFALMYRAARKLILTQQHAPPVR